MSESQGGGTVVIPSLRRVVIDFHAGTIDLEGEDGGCYRFNVVRETVVSVEPTPGNELPSAAQNDVPSPAHAADAQAAPQPTADSSGQKTMRLAGRLKSAPRVGRPDSRGRPTAWAKLACHEEGRDSAKMYSATFHGGTTNKALTLEAESHVVVEGYVRVSDDSKRMDAISVFKIIASGEPEV